jgi:hypothetical protein
VTCTPAATVVGETLVMLGAPAAIVKLAGEEVPPLVVTVMLAVPAFAIRLAGTPAVNCVALT